MSRPGRLFDWLIGLSVFLVPLAPSGPAYLGWPSAAWTDLAFVLLAVAAVAASCTHALGARHSDRSVGSSAPAWRAVGVWWAAFVTVLLASASVALARENAFASGVFAAHLRELGSDIWAGMNQEYHPLFSVRFLLSHLYGLVSFALVGVACRYSESPRRRARTVAIATVAAGGVVGSIALLQYWTRFGLHPYWVEVNPRMVRAHSTLDDPNALAAYLLVVIALAAGLFVHSRRCRARVVAAICVIAVGVGVGGLFAAGSRAALLAGGVLMVGSLLAGAGRWRALHRPLPALVVLLAVGGLMLGLNQVAGDGSESVQPQRAPDDPLEAIARTLQPGDDLGAVLKHRDVWWSAAASMIAQAPLNGVGLGRFPRVVREVRPDAPAAENAHNYFLQLQAESGLFALLLSFGLGVALVAGLWRSAGDLAPVRRGLVAGLAGLAMTCVTGHPLLLASVQIVLGALAGAMLASARVAGGDRRGSTTTIFRRQVAPSFLAVGLATLGVASQAWALANSEGPPLPREEWGYSWGLFSPERDETGEFRWTRERAILHLRVPEGARALQFEMSAAPAALRGEPTAVDLVVQGRTLAAGYFATDEWRAVAVPLPRAGGPRGSIEVMIHVYGSFRPAAAGLDDNRLLGVRLRPPAFLADRE